MSSGTLSVLRWVGTRAGEAPVPSTPGGEEILPMLSINPEMSPDVPPAFRGQFERMFHFGVVSYTIDVDQFSAAPQIGE